MVLEPPLALDCREVKMPYPIMMHRVSKYVAPRRIRKPSKIQLQQSFLGVKISGANRSLRLGASEPLKINRDRRYVLVCRWEFYACCVTQGRSARSAGKSSTWPANIWRFIPILGRRLRFRQGAYCHSRFRITLYLVYRSQAYLHSLLIRCGLRSTNSGESTITYMSEWQYALHLETSIQSDS